MRWRFHLSSPKCTRALSLTFCARKERENLMLTCTLSLSLAHSRASHKHQKHHKVSCTLSFSLLNGENVTSEVRTKKIYFLPHDSAVTFFSTWMDPKGSLDRAPDITSNLLSLSFLDFVSSCHPSLSQHLQCTNLSLLLSPSPFLSTASSNVLKA